MGYSPLSPQSLICYLSRRFLNLDLRKNAKRSKIEPTTRHPLEILPLATPLDPMGGFSCEGVDPLSQVASEKSLELETGDVVRKRDQPSLLDLYHESWSSRTAILNKYTTTERLSIVTSFLSGGETSQCLYISRKCVPNHPFHLYSQSAIDNDGREGETSSGTVG